MVKLSNEAEFPISAAAETALNKLDQLMTRLMLEAEKKCQKVYACTQEKH